MLRRSAVLVVVVAALVAGVWIQQAICEETPAAPPPPPGGRDPAQMSQRMEQFRQQMADRMRQSLGATEEEWKVLQPRIEKVQTLSRQSRGGGMGFMGGGGRRGGGPGGDRGQQPDPNRVQSEVDKKVDALQKILENKEAKADEIKTALAGLREARAKARLELETAQKELREVITVRQEAQLVMMGLLD